MIEHALSKPSSTDLPAPTAQSPATGYMHPGYVASLAEFGTPRELPHCGGWVLERSIPGSKSRDAMGCYPIFTCCHWERLHADIAALSGHLVSLVLVTDPFAPMDKAALDGCFDFAKPFKHHYIADLRVPFQSFVNKHHRYYTRRSWREVEVEVCEEPSRYLREWVELYSHLIRTHNIRGLRAFSAESFRRQVSIPGMVLIIGRHSNEVIGAHLLAIHGNVAYSHLAAFSPRGYEIGAAYGIYWASLDYLTARGVNQLDLGGTAGLENTPTDGLDRFKRGWSNMTRIVYLCGRVLDPQRYAQLCRHRDGGGTHYFPAYRAGEFY